MDKTGIATIVFDEPVESVEVQFAVAMDGSVSVILNRSATVTIGGDLSVSELKLQDSERRE